MAKKAARDAAGKKPARDGQEHLARKRPPPSGGAGKTGSVLLYPGVLCLIGIFGGFCLALARHYFGLTPPWLRRVRDASAAHLHTSRCGTYTAAGCTPSNCGHLVVDNFATADEVSALAGIAARGMELGGGGGGPTILDLQSGALSYGDKFIDVW